MKRGYGAIAVVDDLRWIGVHLMPHDHVHDGSVAQGRQKQDGWSKAT